MKISNNSFGKGEKIIFPVSFDLKVIMLTQTDPKTNIVDLELLLVQLNIPFKNWRHKPSGKGTYTSYTVRVDIASMELMTRLYADLRKVPNVKMAL